jgi:hypothetical protein
MTIALSKGDVVENSMERATFAGPINSRVDKPGSYPENGVLGKDLRPVSQGAIVLPRRPSKTP